MTAPVEEILAELRDLILKQLLERQIMLIRSPIRNRRCLDPSVSMRRTRS